MAYRVFPMPFPVLWWPACYPACQDGPVFIAAAVNPEKVPVPPTPPKKRMNIIEVPGIITRYWPELFPDGQLRPMKIGLKDDLLPDRKVRELPVSVRTNSAFSSLAVSLSIKK